MGDFLSFKCEGVSIHGVMERELMFIGITHHLRALRQTAFTNIVSDGIDPVVLRRKPIQSQRSVAGVIRQAGMYLVSVNALFDKVHCL